MTTARTRQPGLPDRDRRPSAAGQAGPPPDRRLCVAPMVGVTDRWARAIYRILCPRALLFSEMFVARMLLFTAKTPLRVMRLPAQQGQDPCALRASDPTALQLAGAEPEALVRGAELGQELGYAEINLNLGCPSKKVVKGGFGACQMQRPEQVAELVAAVTTACDLPVSIKTRTGLGDEADGARLFELAAQVRQAGCRTVYLHARNAVLRGLSPAANRSVPPLRYDLALQLRRRFPDVHLVVNGGIAGRARARELLRDFDGVMIGRAAQTHPQLLAALGNDVHGEAGGEAGGEEGCAADGETGGAADGEAGGEARGVVNGAAGDAAGGGEKRGGAARAGLPQAVASVLEMAREAGEPPVRVARHLVGLARERPGARLWRQRVTDPRLDARGCLELLGELEREREALQERGCAA